MKARVVGQAVLSFAGGQICTSEERACFSLSAYFGIPIVYFEKNRVFKAGASPLEYVSMG